MTPSPTHGKRDGGDQETLFGLLGGILLVSALFLLALGLTEAINRALAPLGPLAYEIVFFALVLLLLLGTILVSHLTGWGRGMGAKIRGPDVLERGRARILRWQERSTRLTPKLILYGTLVVPIGVFALEVPELIIGSNPDGSFDFRHWFIFVVLAFGYFMLWLLISSLIAGLWPKGPGVKRQDVLRKGCRRLNGWFDFSRHPVRSTFWMLASIAVLAKASSVISASMAIGAGEPFFATLVYVLILYGLVIVALFLSSLIAGLLTGEPGKE